MLKILSMLNLSEAVRLLKTFKRTILVLDYKLKRSRMRQSWFLFFEFISLEITRIYFQKIFLISLKKMGVTLQSKLHIIGP